MTDILQKANSVTVSTELLGEVLMMYAAMPEEEPGIDYLHIDLLTAAAEEPIIEGEDGQAAFAVESFRRRVLANAKARGSA